MFFRLSKNVVKNVYFDPFGGGYPPSPLNSLYIASAYVFIEKSWIFIKNHLISFIFFFSSPSGWVGDCRRQSPPWRVRGGRAQCNSEGGNGDRFSFVTSSTILQISNLSDLLDSKCSDEEHTTCSGGTIAEGASDSAVNPRVCREAGGADTSWEPQPHIFYFSTIS